MQNSLIQKKIEIIRKEINPFLTSRKKPKIKFSTDSEFQDKHIIEQLADRIIIEPSLKDIDSSNKDVLSSSEDKEIKSFRDDFIKILEGSSRNFLFDFKKKKSLLLIYSPHSDNSYRDLCVFFANKNKDIYEEIDILFLLNYYDLEIEM